MEVEGSRSFKAIAFISRKGNIRLEAKTYSEVRMTLKRKTYILSRNVIRCLETTFIVPLTIEMGEKEWKK
jgi:hypothetical protein